MDPALVVFLVLLGAAFVGSLFIPASHRRRNRFNMTAHMTAAERIEFWDSCTPEERERAARLGVF